MAILRRVVQWCAHVIARPSVRIAISGSRPVSPERSNSMVCYQEAGALGAY
jgi:hypothetical protein